LSKVPCSLFSKAAGISRSCDAMRNASIPK
jgi:hypothetical protein